MKRGAFIFIEKLFRSGRTNRQLLCTILVNQPDDNTVIEDPTGKIKLPKPRISSDNPKAVDIFTK